MSKWYALYVSSRSEKKVSERLQFQGWEIFCPLKKEIRQWSDRKKKVLIPYFPSYVFVRCSWQDDRLAILQTQGVLRFVYWNGKPAVIRDNEMLVVKKFFSSHKDHSIQSKQIVEGQAYRINQGPFEGQKGIAVWQNSVRATLVIPALNLSFSVEKKKLFPS